MENYFRDVNIYEVSDEERQRVAIFHEHTHQPAPNWKDKNMWGHLQKSIGWVRAFDGKPIEAATFTEGARAQYHQTVENLFTKYFDELPEDVQQEVAAKWEEDDAENPISDELWAKAERKAEIELDEQLYQKIYDYLDKQIEKQA